MTNLPPGRELDALIAEKVMGWHRKPAPSFDRHHALLVPHESITVAGAASWEVIADIQAPRNGLPHYSTSIADAWAVVEKWRELGFDVDITAHHGWQYGCRIAPKGTFNTSTHFESADTAPHAICLAALKAVEGKV